MTDQRTRAEVRLAQYGERTTSYNSSTEKALHQIATEMQAEILRLRNDLVETDKLAAAAGSWKLRGSTAEAEVTRLRAERETFKLGNEVLDASVTELRESVVSLRADRERLLAFANWTARNTYPLTEIHTAALTAIDSPSTRAALVDLAEVAAEVAAGESAGHQPHCVAATQGCCSCEEPTTPAEPARPSPDHSAVYLDEDGHLWSDYPTLPPGDDVLPMVWASERAQSRADLAERGHDLRVIGWCNP